VESAAKQVSRLFPFGETSFHMPESMRYLSDFKDEKIKAMSYIRVMVPRTTGPMI
jgi:hypothetical protein